MHGVAGARIASTSPNSASARSRYQRRNFCAEVDQGRRNHRAGDQAVAHGGVVVGGTVAQPVEMQRRPLGCGDDVSGGPRPRHFRHLDFARYSERRRDLHHRGGRFRRHPVAEIAAGDGDAQAIDAAREQRQRRFHRPLGADGIVGIGALHGVVARREVGDSARERARDDRSSTRTESSRRATAGHRSASTRTRRTATTAPGSSRWCRSRARAAPAAPPPRRPSRRTSRRSSATCRAGCARDRHGRSRR